MSSNVAGEDLSRYPSWTPGDVARHQQDLLQWLKGSDARRWSKWLVKNYAMVEDGGEAWLPESWREDMISQVGVDEPIWLDESFTKMLRAAALSWPESSLQPEDLISPNGFLVFEKPILFSNEDLGGGVGSAPIPPIRAITWAQYDDPKLGHSLDISVWITPPPGRTTNSIMEKGGFEPRGMAPGLINFYRLQAVFNKTLAKYEEGVSEASEASESEKENVDSVVYNTTEEHVRVIALLASILPISRTSYAINETRREFIRRAKDRRGRTPKSRIKGVKVRLSYLRHPEFGDFELESAKEGHSGKRLHWVRGHWRNQWYPSIKSHRVVWIEGFLRGDSALGMVEGPKVLVGKG